MKRSSCRISIPHRPTITSTHRPQPCYRRMVSGLLFVLAKPIITHPNDPASLAIAEFLKQNKAHLDFYRPAQQPSNKTKYTAVIGLSIIDDFARMKIQANKTLHTLPPVLADKVDNEVLEYLNRPPELDDEEYDPIELPEHLQPIATDDGIPDSPRGWAFRCPEPPWYETSAAFDAGDGKNCEDFDPDQDPELEYFSDDAVAAWAKAAIDECIEGARPRFYEALAITKEESGCVYSEDYDPQPVTCKWLSYVFSHFFPIFNPMAEMKVQATYLVILSLESSPKFLSLEFGRPCQQELVVGCEVSC